ncbi:MAG TPA: hypothetical protein VF210_22075 [Pseudomonadales bacterium]
MQEHEYLADPDVDAFVRFLRDLTVDGCPGIALRVGAERRAVNRLADAVDAYSWQDEPFSAIYAKLDVMRREMRGALERCAEARGPAEKRLAELELLFVSTKALSFGRLYEGAFPFLIHQAETGVLSQNLRQAAAVLDGCREQVDAFDDRPFRSDCAMSKVYAMMNRRTVVYDDRLGAALGLLCRLHLERERRTAVPDALRFMVGEPGQPERDPSDGSFRFTEKRAGREHARWNLRATWIVSRLAADPELAARMGGGARERIRRIEAALFMIGENVADQLRAVSPPARAARRVVVPISSWRGGKRSSR